MSAVKDLFDQIMRQIERKTKKAGSDYTGKVTRVEGDTAYVQFDGSEINDTPVQLSIGAKPGDKVNIRVVNGKASLIGNVTEPPTNDGERIKKVEEQTSHIRETTDQVVISVGKKMNSDMSNRPSSIVIDSGKIAFESNSIVIESDNFKLRENGNAEFSGTLDSAGGTFNGRVRVTNEDDYSVTGVDIGWDMAGPIHISERSKNNTWNAGGNFTATEVKLTEKNGDVATGWVGISTVYGYDFSSDRRIKHDIEKLTGLNLVMRLSPVTFKLNYDKSGKTHYGFIAQDVQEVMPEIVRENDGILGFGYTQLIAPAIAAIQEQQEQIQKLIDRVESLERRMDDGK